MSLLLTAAFFYLPNHILVVSNRIWYYIHGEFYEGMRNGLGQTTGVKSVAQATTTAALSASSATVTEILAQTAEQVLRGKNEL